MAKLKTQNKKKKKTEIFHLTLNTVNFAVIGAGILVIIIGYVFLSDKSVDGFLPTVLAPILLVLGYCVIIPIGILMNFRDKGTSEPSVELKEDEVETEVSTGTSSNVKVH